MGDNDTISGKNCQINWVKICYHNFILSPTYLITLQTVFGIVKYTPYQYNNNQLIITCSTVNTVTNFITMKHIDIICHGDARATRIRRVRNIWDSWAERAPYSYTFPSQGQRTYSPRISCGKSSRKYRRRTSSNQTRPGIVGNSFDIWSMVQQAACVLCWKGDMPFHRAHMTF